MANKRPSNPVRRAATVTSVGCALTGVLCGVALVLDNPLLLLGVLACAIASIVAVALAYRALNAQEREDHVEKEEKATKPADQS